MNADVFISIYIYLQLIQVLKMFSQNVSSKIDFEELRSVRSSFVLNTLDTYVMCPLYLPRISFIILIKAVICCSVIANDETGDHFTRQK